MEFYERISEARMHAAFYRPNDCDLPAITSFLLEDINIFAKNCIISLNEMHNILTFNKIWKQRLTGVGSYNYELALSYGLTGVMARCAGLKRDLRLELTETYGNYYYLNFRGFIGTSGDSYDRFLIRMNEMCESLLIVNQLVLRMLHINRKNTYAHHLLEIQPEKFAGSGKNYEYNLMEKTITHFKSWSEGFPVKTNLSFRSIESPKGELSVTLMSDNTGKPFRCKLRSPAYHHLQVLPILAKGHYLADLVALLGTIDIVFGEIDR